MIIAHISDLHLNWNGKTTFYKKVEELIRKVSLCEPDHIVISGDVSEDGREEDFLFLRELLIKFDLLNPLRTTLVIGNHDIFGTAINIEDALSYPDRCKNTDYEDRVLIFTSYFRELFEGDSIIHGTSIYPFLKRVGDVFILGMNSIEKYSTRNFAASNGLVKKEQRIAAEKLIRDHWDSQSPLLLAIHHHFYRIERSKETFAGKALTRVENSTMKLRKKKKLLRWISDTGFSAVLHGHFHQQRVYKLGGVTYSNSGGSIKNGLGPVASANFIDVTANTVRVETLSLNTDERILTAIK